MDISYAHNPSDCDTVGAVTMDANSNLAAATSTGGLSCKLPGRVGDSAVIGESSNCFLVSFRYWYDWLVFTGNFRM